MAREQLQQMAPPATTEGPIGLLSVHAHCTASACHLTSYAATTSIMATNGGFCNVWAHSELLVTAEASLWRHESSTTVRRLGKLVVVGGP